MTMLHVGDKYVCTLWVRDPRQSTANTGTAPTVTGTQYLEADDSSEGSVTVTRKSALDSATKGFCYWIEGPAIVVTGWHRIVFTADGDLDGVEPRRFRVEALQ